MLRFRQSNLRPRGTRVRLRHSGGGAGFTLIELIFVMVLLAIGAAMVAPAMASFYRGRLLNSEARRLLTLANYGQSRAIAEGVPVAARQGRAVGDVADVTALDADIGQLAVGKFRQLAIGRFINRPALQEGGAEQARKIGQKLHGVVL